MKIEILSLISMTAIFASCCAKVPANIGIKDGRLNSCPDKPNCVSSESNDKLHHIEPFKYSTDFLTAKNAVIETIKSQERTVIVTDSGSYIHAEFKSKILRFTDDVEFLIDDKTKIINIRSASRVGYSDMGVNRKRVEILRKIFQEKIK